VSEREVILDVGILSTHLSVDFLLRTTCISSELIFYSWLMSIDKWLKSKTKKKEKFQLSVFLFLNISSARFMIVIVISRTDGQQCRNLISVQCYLFIHIKDMSFDLHTHMSPLSSARIIFPFLFLFVLQ